jgi:hypothetical protein
LLTFLFSKVLAMVLLLAILSLSGLVVGSAMNPHPLRGLGVGLLVSPLLFQMVLVLVF